MTTTPQKDEGKGWSNSAELSFIEHLASKREAKGLLRGYLRGMEKRVNFGSIDRRAAKERAEELLVILEFESAVQSRRVEVA